MMINDDNFRIQPGQDYDHNSMFQLLCKSVNKWGLYLWWLENNDEDVAGYIDRVVKNSGGLLNRDSDSLFNDSAYFLYDTEDELKKAFDGISDVDEMSALTISNKGVWFIYTNEEEKDYV